MKHEYIYLGPRCDYDPDTPTNFKGQTWQELEAYREANRAEIRRHKEYERKASGLKPQAFDPLQQYAHPYLVGKKLDKIVAKFISMDKTQKKKLAKLTKSQLSI